jgi:hypothetical protein
MESYLLIILLSIIIIYKYCNTYDVVYVECFNDLNHKKYLVRDLPDKEEAIKMLSLIESTLKKLINRLLNDESTKENIDMFGYIQRISEKMDDVEIQESTADSKYTSYTVNKGELLVLCIRSKETSEIHNFNDLLYVAIHEIAHIGCPEVGHTDLFFEINTFLIDKAIEYNIYKYTDYSLNNVEYCGMELTTTVASK